MNFQAFFLFAHIMFLICALVGILYADTLALSWIRGISETLDAKDIRRAHRIVGWALAGLIATGLYLFWPLRSFLLLQTPFYLKMFFVLVLIVNSMAIGTLMHVTTRKSFRSLTKKERTPLMVSGAASLLCWIGAAVAAYMLFGLGPLVSLV
jgi:hypothetical protein